MYFGTDSITGEVVWRDELINMSQYVIISEEEIKEIVKRANTEQKDIVIGEDGRPMLANRADDALSDAAVQICRYETLLKESDYKIIKAYEYYIVTGEQLQEYDMVQLHAERDFYRSEINRYRIIAGVETNE